MSIFDKIKSSMGTALSLEEKYEREKQLATKGAVKERLSLAKNSDTHKEILFYLAAHDPEDKVRKAVAKNKNTPLHASATLAIDGNADVRLELAGRLVKILPDLSVDTQSQLYAYAVQALGTLALDEVLKIRKSLSSTLKDHAYAPPAVAAQLAKDIEREVAEPILRFCVALKDEDLIDILANHPAAWAAQAVAKRKSISAPVSKAVIKAGDATAGKILLNNKGAVISEDVLQVIVERAKEFPEWHEPLVTQYHLPKAMARQLARYVDTRIRKLLEKKGGYDLQVTEIVSDATRRRISLENEMQSEGDIPPREKAQKLFNEGKLSEEILSDYLALRDKDFITAALSVMVNSTEKNIAKIFSLQKPQMVCAVCWRAGLSMRFALRLQQEMAQIPHKELIYPKGGTDYPLDKKDMIWQLEFLDIAHD